MNSDFRARPGGTYMGSHKSGRWWKEDSKPKASVSYIVRLSRKQIKPRNPDLTESFHPSLRENYYTIIWLLVMYNIIWLLIMYKDMGQNKRCVIKRPKHLFIVNPGKLDILLLGE